ncbi:BRCT domain-containing protein [uncultured Secundilactobacillus sp.]|uniref:BRCT domain-containing protein n=1 Tax=uncultured Secundilactobacillus sp. TaxID=2813935 RepID=UPI002587A480|nr:BRCT domain-containing protein [uncultured Secundilactobacillus sp.]
MSVDLKQCEVVFTGQLESMTRQQAMDLSQLCGAKPKSQVTKQTHFVIVGKVEKTFNEPLTTRKLNANVPVVTESEFLAWCGLVLTQRAHILDRNSTFKSYM